MRRKWLTAGAIAALLFGLFASPASAQDYEWTTQDILDNTWLLIAAVLVLFMQAGFALVEAGMTRSKNAGNIMMKNMMDIAVAGVAFFVVGYGFAFGLTLPLTVSSRLIIQKARSQALSEDHSPPTACR